LACSDDTESGGPSTATGGSGGDAGTSSGGQSGATAGGATAGGATAGGAAAGGAAAGGAGGAVACAPGSDVHVWLDHEDADLSNGYWSNSVGAYMGWWDDETGTFALTLDEGPCSAKAAHFTLTDSTGWGFGFDAGFPSKCHDVSGYEGLVLWVKAGDENIKVDVALITNNPLGTYKTTQALTPATEWAKIKIPFSAFTDSGVPLTDASEIERVSFNVVRKNWLDPQPEETFEIWFDDLGVYGGDGTATTVDCSAAGGAGGAGGNPG
jgi:hypothetical protein